MHIKEYKVFACEKPTESNPVPQVFVNTVFAKNEIVARGKTFNLLKKQYKIKLSTGVVLRIEEVPQYSDGKVRIFGVSATYIIKRKVITVHQMISAVTRVDAVFKMWQTLRSKHSVRPETVGILNVSEIAPKDVTNKELLQLIDSPRYPLFDKRVPATVPVQQVVAYDRA